jgi:hypothetical protein
MTTIDTTGTDLVVHVVGLDRLWSFKSELRVPLAHVVGVSRAEDEARTWWHGLRAPGTHLPGVITAGTFHEHEGNVFWDVHKPENAVGIRLHDERYSRLVIEVADVESTIARIESAIATTASAGATS